MFKKAIALIVALLLCSCAYEWRHPSKSKDMFDRDLIQCEKDAWQIYQPILVQTERSAIPQTPPNQIPANQHCQIKDEKTLCTNTLPSHSFPSLYPDINKKYREVYIYTCLQKLGWHQEKQSNSIH